MLTPSPNSCKSPKTRAGVSCMKQAGIHHLTESHALGPNEMQPCIVLSCKTIPACQRLIMRNAVTAVITAGQLRCKLAAHLCTCEVQHLKAQGTHQQLHQGRCYTSCAHVAIAKACVRSDEPVVIGWGSPEPAGPVLDMLQLPAHWIARQCQHMPCPVAIHSLVKPGLCVRIFCSLHGAQ